MPRKSTTEEFIAKAKLVHGDKYDYSKVIYKNCDTNIIIICKIHGEFEQTPCKHLQGHGCSICNRENSVNNLLGQKFGKLLVIKKTEKRTSARGIFWLCKCDCGNEKMVSSSNLIRGSIKSCGCIAKEITRKMGLASRTDLLDLKYIQERDLLLKKANLVLVDEFWENKRLTLKIQCNCCNKTYNIVYFSLKNGVKCSCHRNKTESRIRNILENMFNCSFNYRSNKIPELERKSPDGYNSELNLVLEYNGSQKIDKNHYFYNNKYVKDYFWKVEIYQKLNLDLLEIWDYEIKDMNDFEISELIITKLDLLGRTNIPKLKKDFVHIQNPRFLTYEEAQKVCIENGIKSLNDYKNNYVKISKQLPSRPYITYVTNWVSWGEFLGTENIKGSKLNNSSSKKVLCIETDVIYCSMSEAHRSTGISISSISDCCLGRHKTAGDYHWEYVNEESK